MARARPGREGGPVRPSMCSALGCMSHKAHPSRLWRGRGVPLPVTADETKACCGYVTFFIKQLLRVPLSARWGTQGAPNVTSVPVVVVGQASSCCADQALLQTVRGNRVVGTGSDGEQRGGGGRRSPPPLWGAYCVPYTCDVISRRPRRSAVTTAAFASTQHFPPTRWCFVRVQLLCQVTAFSPPSHPEQQVPSRSRVTEGKPSPREGGGLPVTRASALPRPLPRRPPSPVWSPHGQHLGVSSRVPCS